MLWFTGDLHFEDKSRHFRWQDFCKRSAARKG